ncbi:MAG: CARDB domain-containing protein, partial [Candidatus Margulisbacteria bacterium]|nr:CARDB domain-containing protein [Candidatus Margulisiibacteriota bacterium]
PHPKKAKQIEVSYEIKNQGGDLLDKSNIKLQVINAQGKVVDSKVVDKTDAGTASFTIANAGKYQIKATADYNDQIRESNESNNSRTVSFSFGVKI